MNMPIGLQLFSLREETERDFIGTLEKVAEIGYKGIEFSGYGDISAVKMKAVLDGLGLEAWSSQASIDKLQNQLDELLEYNLTIGSRYLVLPSSGCNTIEDFLNSFKLYESIGRKCKENEIQFCYHNHSGEFFTYEGEYLFDLLLKRTNPDFLKAEIDVFWVKHAGIDPAGYIKKHAGRCPLIHLKDMESLDTKDYTEIGNGILDIGGIAEVALKSGAERLIVEQDECRGAALESVKVSFENLKRILI